jgi:hypothetical protein
MPAEALRPVTSLILARIASATSRASGMFCGHVEISFVERQWLDDRRVFGEDLTDLLRDGLVDVEPRLDEDQIRALPLRRHRRHGRAYAELACFVAGGGHDAAFAGSTHGHRLAAEIRIVPLLDRRVEG